METLQDCMASHNGKRTTLMIFKSMTPQAVEKETAPWRNTYQWARPYIKNFTVAVDIGAREGGFAREMEDDFQFIQCFDFRKKYTRHFHLNIKDHKKFKYQIYGISDQAQDILTDKLEKSGHIKECTDPKKERVIKKLRTLDSFGIENVGFIKMDIEGYELKAIKGAEQTIKSTWPVIVIEQNQGNIHAQELLESWGYKCLGSDSIHNNDFLMVKYE